MHFPAYLEFRQIILLMDEFNKCSWTYFASLCIENILLFNAEKHARVKVFENCNRVVYCVTKRGRSQKEKVEDLRGFCFAHAYLQRIKIIPKSLILTTYCDSWANFKVWLFLVFSTCNVVYIETGKFDGTQVKDLCPFKILLKAAKKTTICQER